MTVETWTDFAGREWRVAKTKSRLTFSYPAHAALRVHVFQRDNYRCRSCGCLAAEVPSGYDGRDTLSTSIFKDGFPVLLVLDHVVPRAAGGSHRVENLQTLCETCNLKKLRFDIPQIRAAREARAA